VPTAFESIDWESCLIERHSDRAIETYARKKQGLPNPTIGYFVSVPWLARANVDLQPTSGLLMRVDPDLADLVALTVSQENSCRFCFAVVRALLWAQGMSRARIQRLEQDLTRADLPERTVAAITYGRIQSRSGPAEARAAGAALRQAGFGPEEHRELAYTVAASDFLNRLHTIPAIPTRPVERIPDQIHIRLLRPLIGRILRSHRFAGQAAPLDRSPSPPYVRLLEAYEGSPIAPALGRTLDQMWASPHLTRRCKLLMLAVIARGLTCEVCAREVGEALRAEGLEGAALTRIVTHLDAPELDPVERTLVPFARETIWYEPATLQRRARALRDRLSAAQLLEAIGVVSLGNGLCRMAGMVLDPQ
jgi:AhpD family alkylhydroperoxidase